MSKVESQSTADVDNRPALDADVLSGLWTADRREQAVEAAQGMFDADILRADADKADITVFSAVTSLLAVASPTHDADGVAIDHAVRVKMTTWGWYSSVRSMVLEQYRLKRPGLNDNSYDKAWSRVVELIDRCLAGGFKAPVSDSAEAVKKAAQRAEAKAKAEAERKALLAAFEDKSEADLLAQRKALYAAAGEGNDDAEAELERVKRVLDIRKKASTDEAEKAVSSRWEAIKAFGKRKVDGQDNPAFVSDVEVLDAVIALLSGK